MFENKKNIYVVDWYDFHNNYLPIPKNKGMKVITHFQI